MIIIKLRKLVISVLLLACYTMPVSASTATTIDNAGDNTVLYFNAHEKNRAWQGVATDGEYIYTTTDQDVNFTVKPDVVWDNNNIISVYDMEGNFIKEKKNAYTETSSLGHFMSFGDIQHIDGSLFATVYDRTPPYESRVVKYSLPSLEQVAVYPIGDELAEGLDKHDGYYWMVYHSTNVIKQFDENFKLVKTHVASESPGVNAGYQGLFWKGDYLYANLHGANSNGEYYAPGLDKYYFNGNKFTFVERIKPPTYGSGQGVESYGGKYFWTDRPENRIVITSRLKNSQLKTIDSPTAYTLINPDLLNGWERYDNDRTASFWKDAFGVVHFEGLAKNGYVVADGDLKPMFILPEEYRPKEKKNFVVITDKGFGRLAIYPDGQVFAVSGGNGFFSVDGITFMTLKSK